MSKSSIKKPLVTAIGAAVVGSLSVTTTIAADNPFAMQELGSGYMQVALEGKCGEGKCGEGKCGSAAEEKSAEGKCGGAGGAAEKAAEGKCGEGKCGSAAEEKTSEGKCGEAKCGASK